MSGACHGQPSCRGILLDALLCCASFFTSSPVDGRSATHSPFLGMGMTQGPGRSCACILLVRGASRAYKDSLVSQGPGPSPTRPQTPGGADLRVRGGDRGRVSE